MLLVELHVSNSTGGFTAESVNLEGLLTASPVVHSTGTMLKYHNSRSLVWVRETPEQITAALEAERARQITATATLISNMLDTKLEAKLAPLTAAFRQLGLLPQADLTEEFRTGAGSQIQQPDDANLVGPPRPPEAALTPVH